MILKYQIYIIYAISFMDLFAVGLIFPLLYPHIRSLGASHFTVGLLGSTYSAFQVLSGPLVGSWSDIKGKRSVLISTLFLSSFCYILLGLTSSVLCIFILRVSLGIVKHTQTLCKAIIADLLPRARQAEAYGRSTGLGMLGFVIGPLIGGHISELSNGFCYVCCITAVLFLINIVLVYKLPKYGRKLNTNEDFTSLIYNIHKELSRAFTELTKINWHVYWHSFGIRFLLGVTVSIFYSSQSMFLREKYDLQQRYVGYVISFLSAIGVASGLLQGVVTEKFYRDDISCMKRIYHAFVVLAACFVGFFLAPNLYVYVVLLIPFAISSTSLRIVSMELMLSKSGVDEKGSLSGASNSIMSIARSITPLSTGLVGDIFGENAVMISALVPVTIGMILCTILKKSMHGKGD